MAVQTNDGRWRAEQQWPPADAHAFTTPLHSGTYTGDGGGSVSLPFLTTARTDTIDGAPGTQLASHLDETVTVPAATIAAAETPDFATP